MAPQLLPVSRVVSLTVNMASDLRSMNSGHGFRNAPSEQGSDHGVRADSTEQTLRQVSAVNMTSYKPPGSITVATGQG